MTVQRSVLLPSATVGATGVNSADQINKKGRGVVVTVSKTANSGTSPTVTVTIQGKDPLGNYYTILATAAISSNGVTYYRVYPGLTASANAVASDVLPKIWRVSCAIGGSATPTVDFAVAADVI